MSYSRRASIRSSAVRVGTLGFLALGFLGFAFLTFLGFFLGSGLDISKRSWKVLSSVKGWGPDRTVGGTIFEMWLEAL